MDRLGFRDIFDFLALELHKSAEELRKVALSGDEGAARLVTALEQTNFDGDSLKLVDPLIRPGESTPLVAAEVALTTSRIKALISRQAQFPDATIGPLNIAPDEATVNHYRALIRSHINGLLHSVGAAHSTMRHLHDAIRAVPRLNEIETDFSLILDTLLASPSTVGTLLPRLSSRRADAFSDGVDTAIVAMALRIICGHMGMAIANRSELLELGMAALLQDVALKGSPEEDPEHPAKSSALVTEMGLGMETALLVASHHEIEDDAGRPVFLSGQLLSNNLAVLVSANAILAEVRADTSGHHFETAKNLHHLARMGFLHPLVVRAFTRLYLPKIQAVVIEKAESIKEVCPHGPHHPILWPISGGKAPSVLICNYTECVNSTPQVSRLATDIPFSVGGRVVAVIKKGEYFTCPICTSQLKVLYQKIKEQLNQEVE